MWTLFYQLLVVYFITFIKTTPILLRDFCNRRKKAFRFSEMKERIISAFQSLQYLIQAPFNEEARINLMFYHCFKAYQTITEMKGELRRKHATAMRRMTAVTEAAATIVNDVENDATIFDILLFAFRLCQMTFTYIQMVIAHARVLNALHRARVFLPMLTEESHY